MNSKFNYLILCFHFISWAVFVKALPVGNEELINTPLKFRLEEDNCHIFVGRTEELDEIKWAHVDSKLVVITGPRGSGKSELARKYAIDLKKDNITSVVWIDTETHDTMFNAFRDLAAVIGVDLENKGKTATIREVFQYFAGKKSLFIFDNAEFDNIILNNLASFIKSPKINHVIVTSRDETWDQDKFTIIPLNQFTKLEARNFIKITLEKKINLSPDDATIDKLTDIVGYSPLNLNMAVDFIVKENTLNPGTLYTVEDHISRLGNQETTPTPQVVVVTVNQITDDDIEEFLKNKVKTEAKRIEHQIATETKRITSQISNEAKRFGNRVQNEAKRAEQKIRKVFG